MAHRTLPALLALSLLASSFAAAAPGDPFWTQATQYVFTGVHAGQSVSTNLTVHGNASATVDLAIVNISPGLSAYLTWSTVVVAPGNSSATRLEIGVKSNVTAGWYTVDVRSTERNGTYSEVDRVWVNVVAPPPTPSAQISLSPGEIEIRPGETAHLTLTCTATEYMPLHISHAGLPAGWEIEIGSEYFGPYCYANSAWGDSIPVNVTAPWNATGPVELYVAATYRGVYANDTATFYVKPHLVDTRTCVLGTCVSATVPQPR